MQSNFTSHEPKIHGENQMEPTVDLGDQYAGIIDQYSEFLCHDGKFWIKKDEPASPLRYAILNTHVVLSGNTTRGAASVDVFIPETAMDKTNKTQIIIRKRIIKSSPSGEPCYPTFHCDLWRFVMEFQPETSWISNSEYKDILKRLSPIIERDRKLADDEEAEKQSRNDRQNQAAASRLNPEKSLGDAIAIGVTRALAAMKIQPN